MSNSNSWKDDLVRGYQQFRVGAHAQQSALYEDLGTNGQYPKVMLIGCSDSRADPSDIFNAKPGELFVLRNVANLVPPADSDDDYHGAGAALEFAVTALKVEAIIVMGHESCGGVKGCLAGMGDSRDSYVGKWVSALNGARDRVLGRDGLSADQHQYELELEGIRQSLINLMSFSFIKERVEAGSLALQGAYFSIVRGELYLADEAGQFSPVPVA